MEKKDKKEHTLISFMLIDNCRQRTPKFCNPCTMADYIFARTSWFSQKYIEKVTGGL